MQAWAIAAAQAHAALQQLGTKLGACALVGTGVVSWGGCMLLHAWDGARRG